MARDSLRDDEKPTVATSGTIDRDDECAQCGEPMLFCVDDAEKVKASFCGNFDCPLFLVEIDE